MNNVINLRDYKGDTTKAQDILLKGVSLEYLCSRYSTVNIFDLSIEGDGVGLEGRIVAVVDVGNFGHGDASDPYFAVLEKNETLSEGSKYYLMFWADFQNTDFCHDKEMMGQELLNFYSHMYNTEEVGYYYIARERE